LKIDDLDRRNCDSLEISTRVSVFPSPQCPQRFGSPNMAFSIAVVTIHSSGIVTPNMECLCSTGQCECNPDAREKYGCIVPSPCICIRPARQVSSFLVFLVIFDFSSRCSYSLFYNGHSFAAPPSSTVEQLSLSGRHPGDDTVQANSASGLTPIDNE
jgi:hypothetical protein